MALMDSATILFGTISVRKKLDSMEKSSVLRQKTAICKLNHRLADFLGVLKRPPKNQISDSNYQQSSKVSSSLDYHPSMDQLFSS